MTFLKREVGHFQLHPHTTAVTVSALDVSVMAGGGGGLVSALDRTGDICPPQIIGDTRLSQLTSLSDNALHPALNLLLALSPLMYLNE